MPLYNPFRPGTIVGPGMFAGRLQEMKALERTLFQTSNGNPQHFLIHGERGVGKSSLLLVIECIAGGEIDPYEGSRHSFLTITVELEPGNEYSEIIRKVGAELGRAVKDDQGSLGSAADKTWDFLTRWEVMGVRYNRDEAPRPGELIEELAYTIEQTMSKLSSREGLLILLDEADKPPAGAQLGEFCKILTERLTRRKCHNVMLGLAGISTVISKLRKSHNSSPRIFEMFTLDPLEQDERSEVIQKGLEAAEGRNGFKTNITDKALHWIGHYSEGYPHFIQQYAYCAFEADSDNEISEMDVYDGAFGENGAVQQLGLKYFEELYWDQIGSDEYRKVLQAMATNLDDWTTKKEIRDRTDLKETTLTNAIAALTKREIIIPNTGKRGVYRLPSRTFAVWIRAFTRTSNGHPSQNP